MNGPNELKSDGVSQNKAIQISKRQKRCEGKETKWEGEGLRGKLQCCATICSTRENGTGQPKERAYIHNTENADALSVSVNDCTAR
eukprot:scaffold273221_cov15-Prasinocladus_malaysianus.AAC.1